MSGHSGWCGNERNSATGATPWQRRFPSLSYYLINGLLVLWGVVASDAIRPQAEEIAWQNFGAESVINEIQTDARK